MKSEGEHDFVFKLILVGIRPLVYFILTILKVIQGLGNQIS
jgi:hypothetical protein